LYGCSDSQGISAADGSTNYCNLHNLYANEKKDKTKPIHTDLTYKEKKKSSQLGPMDLDVRTCNTMKKVVRTREEIEKLGDCDYACCIAPTHCVCCDKKEEPVGKLSIPYNYCQYDPERVGCDNTYGCEWDEAEGYCKPSDSEKAKLYVAGYDYCQWDPSDIGCNATAGCHWDATAQKCKPDSAKHEAPKKNTLINRLAKKELRPLKSKDSCIYITSDIMCNMQSNCHWVGYACAPSSRREHVLRSSNNYERVTSGTCESSGLHTITSEDECMEATDAYTAEEKSNGWQYQDCSYNGSVNSNTVPAGCYNTGPSCDSGFMLNMAAYSPVKCSGSLPCMCKRSYVSKTMAAAL